LKTRVSIIGVIIAGVGHILLFRHPPPAKRSNPHQALQHDVGESSPQAAAAAESRPLSDAPSDASKTDFTRQTQYGADAGKTILFREKQARRSPKGEWVKVYAFADGTAQIHAESDEANFEVWEKDPVKAR
jgi:hypothetical protein